MHTNDGRRSMESSLSTLPLGQACEQVLVELCEIRLQLLAGLDEFVGTEAGAWLAQAEHMFLECFRPGHTDSVVVEYARLARLRIQVERALATTLGAHVDDDEDDDQPSSAVATPACVDGAGDGGHDAVD